MVKSLFSSSSSVDRRLMVLLLINGVLAQTVVALGRVTTSYRAIELDLSVIWVGLIAAVFALFPIAFAIRVGRYIDRGNDAAAAWIGSGVITVACAGLAFSGSATTLFAWTALLGIGHLFLMASQQMLCVRCGGSQHMAQVIGNYMVASAIGQGLGPFIVGWVGGNASIPPTRTLFVIALGFAVALLVSALLMRPAPAPQESAEPEVVPVPKLLRIPGLWAVLLASVLLVTATDLLVIYLPVLGAERSIDVKDVGVLLTVRALSSMVARVFFSRLVMALGQSGLMLTSIFIGALAIFCLALPLPLWMLYAAIAVSGFWLGIGTVVAVTLVVDLTPASAHGTANSLRLIGNRIGQVTMPFGAGLVAAAAGVGGVLAVIAGSLVATGLAVRMSSLRRAGPDA